MLAKEASAYLSKAHQNLAAADAALQAGQHNVAASRAYYAAFQASVAALWAEGVRPPHDQPGTLSHTAVQREWSGRLIYRRKLYPPELRTTLQRLYDWRIKADYQTQAVTERQARQACAQSRTLVEHVMAHLGQA
jgi:uncharacterized protein (UPF0332 family)